MSLVLEELTAPGRGGISVLALRGEGALARLRRLAGAARLPAPGELRLVRLRVGEELLDEALVRSEGPEHAELSLHGSPAVVRRLAEALDLPLGAPGEARGAPRSLEEEADALLSHAPCEGAARVLLDQAEGALRRALAALDVRDPSASTARLDELIARGREARFLLRPAVVVLAGPPNAGKSTLFNALLDAERVVVSEEPGTTRDAVRERGLLGAYAVELVDTAGDRAAPATAGAVSVERAGIELGRRVREGADLVLWLARDPAAPLPSAPGGPVLAPLTSAADLLPAAVRARAENAICARDDPATARATVEAVFHAALGLPRAPWRAGRAVPFSERVAGALAALRDEKDEIARRSLLDELLAR